MGTETKGKQENKSKRYASTGIQPPVMHTTKKLPIQVTVKSAEIKSDYESTVILLNVA